MAHACDRHETFDPATLSWSHAGTTPAPLVNCGDLSEIGPQLLMYSGKVFVEGATSATALYDVTSGTNGNCGGTYLCTAGNGYDGPTGLGTPNGDSAF